MKVLTVWMAVLALCTSVAQAEGYDELDGGVPAGVDVQSSESPMTGERMQIFKVPDGLWKVLDQLRSEYVKPVGMYTTLSKARIPDIKWDQLLDKYKLTDRYLAQQLTFETCVYGDNQRKGHQVAGAGDLILSPKFENEPDTCSGFVSCKHRKTGVLVSAGVSCKAHQIKSGPTCVGIGAPSCAAAEAYGHRVRKTPKGVGGPAVQGGHGKAGSGQ